MLETIIIFLALFCISAVWYGVGITVGIARGRKEMLKSFQPEAEPTYKVKTTTKKGKK